MPFRDSQLCLTEMPDGIAASESFLAGVDFSRYRSDLLVRSAVERQLQIITEVAFRLGDDAERLCPVIDWRAIRGLGNVLRHAYDVIDDMIWQTLRTKLPHLKKAVRKALVAFEERGAS